MAKFVLFPGSHIKDICSTIHHRECDERSEALKLFYQYLLKVRYRKLLPKTNKHGLVDKVYAMDGGKVTPAIEP